MEPNFTRAEQKDRLLSLDALRGFDMFWITGGGYLFSRIGAATGQDWMVEQVHHVAWAGLHLYDLIFPLFMFISGVAIPYAIGSRLERNVPKKQLLSKAFRRMIILVVLGILYNGALRGDFTEVRFASVLGQIGIAYFIAAAIFIYTRSFRSRVAWVAGILLGYACIQLFIPVPGIGAGVITPEGVINGFIDRNVLPGILNDGIFDPEGLLCIVSASGLTLMGTIAGHWLRSKGPADWQKILRLSGLGAVLVLLSWLIHPYYPVVKKCWTSTFNLAAGGISFILTALFYMIIDVMKKQKWSFYFRVIGMNSIFVYLFTHFFDIRRPAEYFFGWGPALFGEAAQFIPAIGALAIVWTILYFMYRKGVFLRV